MDKVILHSDLNNFYASVECLYNPAIRNKPVAVCGDVEARHGIVLAKNYIAKGFGVTTGQAIWQAKQQCPNLVVVPPHFEKYLNFSKIARDIYSQYTDQIEPFGIDEAWLDITGSVKLFGDGKKIADEIRSKIKFEMGVTASVGVSYNKIFAKLGSDLKKPDATTVISRENYRDVVWSLPVKELLYVGRATNIKLNKHLIRTIGDLATSDPNDLKLWLGKWGVMLWTFANGYDTTHVSKTNAESVIKSVGNSTTTPRDLINDEDVKITIYMLAESVSARLRMHNLICNTVQIYVRDTELSSFERQGKLDFSTSNSTSISLKAYELFKRNYRWDKPIRSIGVRACNLDSPKYIQTSFIPEVAKTHKLDELECTIDDIRRRFGRFSIQRGVMFTDRNLSDLNPKDDHIIHPVSYLK